MSGARGPAAKQGVSDKQKTGGGTETHYNIAENNKLKREKALETGEKEGGCPPHPRLPREKLILGLSWPMAGGDSATFGCFIDRLRNSSSFRHREVSGEGKERMILLKIPRRRASV